VGIQVKGIEDNDAADVFNVFLAEAWTSTTPFAILQPAHSYKAGRRVQHWLDKASSGQTEPT
jgi:hypothetical protein